MAWEGEQGVPGLCVCVHPSYLLAWMRRCDTASPRGKKGIGSALGAWQFVIAVSSSPVVVELFVLLVWLRNRGYAGLDPSGQIFHFHF